MKPLKPNRIGGTWGTLMLPIVDDDAIDFGKLADEIDILIDSKVDGIYSNGSTGELHNQDESETDRVNTLLAEKCEAAGMPFQIGASHMDPRISLSRAHRAKALNPQRHPGHPAGLGSLQRDGNGGLPRTHRGKQSILSAWCFTCRGTQNVHFGPKSIGRLAQRIPTLFGLKVLGGDADWFASMKKHAPRLSIFVPGHELATMTPLGAHGSYSNVACLSPKGAMKWQASIQSDYSAALDLEKRIKQFMVEHIVPYRDQLGHSNTALDKLLAAVGNWSQVGTRLRWPYRGVPEVEAGRLRPIARQQLPELFE